MAGTSSLHCSVAGMAFLLLRHTMPRLVLIVPVQSAVSGYLATPHVSICEPELVAGSWLFLCPYSELGLILNPLQ